MVSSIHLILLVFVAQIRPGWTATCKDDDTVEPKYVGDPCTTEKECTNPYSSPGLYVCKNGLCQCGPAFVATQISSISNRSYCTTRPTSSYVGQSCTGGCALPYTCVPDNITFTFTTPRPPPMPTGQVMIMPMPIDIYVPPPIKRCQCLPPYKYTGSRCIKECQPDEIQMQNGDCRKKCAADEIVDEQNQCKKVANLGQPCETDIQCVAAYSTCQDGTCKCKDGFNANEGRCDAVAYRCRGGSEVRQANGSVMLCRLVRSAMPPKVEPAPVGAMTVMLARPYDLEDTCGAGKWCQIIERAGARPSGEGEGDIGFCCTKPDISCPIGQPYAAAPQCTPPYYSSTSGPSSGIMSKSCPKTHECLLMGPDPPLCCPKMCAPDKIGVDGKCYQKRQYGEACQVNEQCRGHNGVCLEGRCTCGPKFITLGPSVPESERYCSRQCSFDEYYVNGNECAPKLKLGQPCSGTSAPCPNFAYCNKQGVCACRCTAIPLGDNYCGSPPSCRNSNLTEPIVFCKGTTGPYGSPNIPTVDQCPDGKVCSYYTSGVGICCPRPPDAKCPSSTWITQGPCVSNATTPCPAPAMCMMSFSPANTNDRTGGVCCQPPPTTRPMPITPGTGTQTPTPTSATRPPTTATPTPTPK